MPRRNRSGDFDFIRLLPKVDPSGATPNAAFIVAPNKRVSSRDTGFAKLLQAIELAAAVHNVKLVLESSRKGGKKILNHLQRGGGILGVAYVCFRSSNVS